MNSPDSNEAASRGGTFAIALLLYAAVICLTAIRAQPPAAKPANAPADEFSGVRAKALLQELVGKGVPHPIGSAADAAVREGIVAQLTSLSYQPRVQDSFVCGDFGRCAGVKNVVARLDGREAGAAVMISAHYDSVPAGPGVSDDGAGVVSVLEIARALKASPPPRHSVIFLLDEGEEAGLLGAEAFVEDDPWAKDVRADVNLDNRGTSGISTMFETGDANEWLMRLFAKSNPLAQATSLSYKVYKLLPNDTDFTIFKAAGYQGFNFAFIDGVAHYHTPLDDFANATAGSIQSEGENGLAAARGLANSDLNFGKPADAVFASVLGWRMIWWPARRTPELALVALILLLIEIGALIRRGHMSGKKFAMGMVSWPAIMILCAALAAAMQWVMHGAGVTPTNWAAHPSAILTAFWALGFGVAAATGALLARAAGFWGQWSGIWVWWAVVALALGILLPGVSFVFVVPALAAGILGLAIVFFGRRDTAMAAVAGVIPAIVAAIVGLEIAWFLYAAMGNALLAGIGIFVALIASPLAQFAGGVAARNRWKFPAAAFATIFAAAVIAVLVPPFSAASPEGLNLQYRQDADTAKSQWLAYPDSGVLPAELMHAAAFARAKKAIDPWDLRRPFSASAPAVNLPAPELDIRHAGSSAAGWEFEALLKSPRGAPVMVIGFPPGAGVTSVSMAGHPLGEIEPRILRYTRGWHLYSCVDVPPQGIEVKFSVPSASKPESVVLMDKSYGLPPQGEFLEKARPSTAVANNSGDVSVVTRRLTLKPQ